MIIGYGSNIMTGGAITSRTGRMSRNPSLWIKKVIEYISKYRNIEPFFRQPLIRQIFVTNRGTYHHNIELYQPIRDIYDSIIARANNTNNNNPGDDVRYKVDIDLAQGRLRLRGFRNNELVSRDQSPRFDDIFHILRLLTEYVSRINQVELRNQQRTPPTSVPPAEVRRQGANRVRTITPTP